MKSCKAYTGKIVHAAVEVPNTVGGNGERFTALFALCGKAVPKTSLTVGFLETFRPVNCPSCLKRMLAK